MTEPLETQLTDRPLINVQLSASNNSRRSGMKMHLSEMQRLNLAMVNQ